MSFVPVDVADLIGQPGAFREIGVRGTPDEHLATAVAEVPGEVAADLLLESVVEGIIVSGRLSGTFSLRCARCLEAFERPLAIDVHELFAERPDPDGDEYPLEPEGLLDVGPMALDAIGLEMPFSPLCRPDCLGICEVCGGNRNLGECPGHEQIDPRWAGLEAALERMHD